MATTSFFDEVNRQSGTEKKRPLLDSRMSEIEEMMRLANVADPQSVAGVCAEAQQRWDDFTHGSTKAHYTKSVLATAAGVDDIAGLFIAGVYQVKEIDAVTGTFVITVSCRVRWRDEALAEFIAGRGKVGKDHALSEELVRDLREQGLCVPWMVYENAAEQSRAGTLKLRVHDEPRKLLALYERTTLRNDSYMLLHHFPFDMQLMTTTIRVKTPTKHGLEKNMFVAVDSSTFKGWVTHNTLKDHILATQEWDFKNPITKVSPMAKSKSIKYEFKLHCHRKSIYYVKNILWIQAGMVIVAFLSFVGPAENFTDRCEITVSMLLTSVAFKLVIADKVPKVAYDTMLDIYLFKSLQMLFAIIVLQAVTALAIRLSEGGLIPSTSFDLVGTADVVIFFILALFWGLFHVWFMVTKRSIDKANAEDNEELPWGLPSLGSTERQQKSQKTLSVGAKLTLLKLKVKGIGAAALENSREAKDGEHRTSARTVSVDDANDSHNADSRDIEEPRPPSVSSRGTAGRHDAKARGRGGAGASISSSRSSRSRDREEDSRASSSTTSSKSKANAVKAL